MAKLGISPSSAIQMLYSQIVIRNGLPFDLRLPERTPVAIGGMTRMELDLELAKGIASIDKETTKAAEDFESIVIDNQDSI